MKKIVILLITLLSAVFADDIHKPYILIGETGKAVERTTSMIIKKLFFTDLEVLGKYAPAGDPDKYVIVVTHPLLFEAISLGKPNTGFLTGIRIGITKKGEMTYISCQNPRYWANAYFQSDYPKVAHLIDKFTNELLKAIPNYRLISSLEFGSVHGIKAKDLWMYRYKRKMPYFTDTIVLGKFDSFEAAVQTIENKLSKSKACAKVFEKKLPGKKIKLYGIELKSDKGEKHILKIVDKSDRKHTAAFPYEILVLNNEIRILHVHFRLPLSFPDMDKKTFKKLKTKHDEIEDILKTLLR